MSFTSQISLGYAPFPCDSCSELFWARPEVAQARTSIGKKIHCRTCQVMRGNHLVPAKAAKRLTDDEIAEMQLETVRSPVFYSSPSPQSPMEPVVPRPALPEKTVHRILRQRVYRLHGKEKPPVGRAGVMQFSRSAGVAPDTVLRIIDRRAGRATNKKVLAKLADTIVRQGWHLDEKPVFQSRLLPNEAFDPTPEPKEEANPAPEAPADRPSSPLDAWFKANVLHGVLMTELTREEKQGIISALFTLWK